mmetsp:Transcript_46560/g.87172  ORF Transcript_46560/g.87172 Transcript_46560/m.87172 type:complete len:368 (+) Transcript_46560:33-1136(+)
MSSFSQDYKDYKSFPSTNADCSSDTISDRGASSSFDCLEWSKVERVEWRKVRRLQYRGLTSHSWIEAHMLDGHRLRLEFFGDYGLSVTTLTHTSCSGSDLQSTVGTLFRNRAAAADEFSEPLTVGKLKDLSSAIASSRPYCLLNFNCHHFARDVWNAVVIKQLQRRHHPDRMKTAVLQVLEGAAGTISSRFAPFASAASTAPSFVSADQMGVKKPVNDDAAASPRSFLAEFRKSLLEDDFRIDIASVSVQLLEVGQDSRTRGHLVPINLPPGLWEHDYGLNQYWIQGRKKDENKPPDKVVSIFKETSPEVGQASQDKKMQPRLSSGTRSTNSNSSIHSSTSNSSTGSNSSASSRSSSRSSSTVGKHC